MATGAFVKLMMLILSIVVASSYGKNYEKSSSSCKSVLLGNCSESFCVANITIVNKCPTNWTSDIVRKKCENFTVADLCDDAFLLRPMTNELENVTYWNVYCALCNGKHPDTNRLKLWTVRAYYRGNISSKSGSFLSGINSAAMKKLQEETQQLVSNADFIRDIIPLRYLPPGLKNSSFELCWVGAAEGIGFLRENNTDLSPVPEDLDCVGKKFRPNGNSQIPQPGTCVYFNKDRILCSKNKFLVQNIDFVYAGIGSKIMLDDGSVFDSDAYSTLNENVIFLCSSVDDRHSAVQIMDECIDYIKYISTFLLFVFLVMRTNKKNLKSLPKLVLYSYCVASLNVYLLSIFNHLICGRMLFSTYLLLYLNLCHAIWAAIISYEYWFAVSKALKCQQTQLKLSRYRIYGFVGWVLPAVLLCAVYPSLTEEDRSMVCPCIPNHPIYISLNYSSELACILLKLLLMLYPLIFVILILVMAVQSYNFIRLTENRRIIRRQSADRRRRPTHSTNRQEKDYLFLFTKIAYLMGIHCMLFCIAVLISAAFDGFASIIEDVGKILFACHGTFIFFAFSFETVRTKYRSTYRSFVSRSTRTSRVESITVEMKPGANDGEIEPAIVQISST